MHPLKLGHRLTDKASMNAAQKQDQHLERLFRDCTELRAGFNRIEREAEKVRGISMNAAVVAAQIGSHVKVFNEVATQIATSAQRMKQRTTQMRDEVNEIVNLTLRAQVVNSRIDKMETALAIMQSSRNRALVLGARDAGYGQLRAIMREIGTHVQPTNSLLKTVMQYQYRMIAALNALKVETVDLVGAQQQAMAALADSLSETTDSGIASLEEVLSILKTITFLTNSLDRIASQEVASAKVRAA
jgi:DNA repair exonuclease SbcCD ATPase subunit